jgi:hypothetical protein
MQEKHKRYKANKKKQQLSTNATPSQWAKIRLLESGINNLFLKSNNKLALIFTSFIFNDISLSVIELDKIFAIFFKDEKVSEPYELLIKTAFVMFSRYFIVNPCLNKIFPIGIFNKNPMPTIDKCLTKIEATNTIKSLDHYYDALKQQADDLFNQFTVIVVTLLIVYNLALKDLIDQEPIVCRITLVIALAVHWFGILQTYYKQQRLDTSINKQAELLGSAFSHYLISLQTTKLGGRSESCYFIMNFKNQELSSRKIVNLFKDYCLLYNIEIVARDQNTVTLFAQPGINPQRISIIKELFTEAIAREKSITSLIRQIKLLQNKLGDEYFIFIIKPKYDKTNLPKIIADILIDPSLMQHTDKFVDIFQANQPKIFNKENKLCLRLKGFSPCNRTELNKMIKDICDYKPHDKQDYPVNNQATIQSTYYHLASETATNRNANKTSARNKTNFEIPKRQIYWPSGAIYNSKATNNDIYPVPFGKFRDAKALAKTRLFVRNGLDKNHVPELIFTAIDNQVKRPNLAPSKRSQGIVFWRGRYERDMITDKWIRTAAKIKLLGTNGKGKIRAFLEEEKAKSGETLWTVKGLNCDH